MASTATYVYGVVPATADVPKGPGIADAPVRRLADDRIAALVSDVEPDRLKFGREAMTTHARVLEEALGAADTVLPMRFGTVMPGDDSVRDDLLRARGPQLRDQLDGLSGTVEFKLRGTYAEQQLMREVVEADREVARLRESVRQAPDDATYYARIQLGELVAASVERIRQADAAAILDRLAPLALAVQTAEPGHERVALEASFLIARDRIAQFDEAVEDVGRAHAERIRFKYTGPLPPHSFVQMAEA